MTSQPRPVWLTREQRDYLAPFDDITHPGIVAAWDAAPADAVETLAARLSEAVQEIDGASYFSQVEHLLIVIQDALGYPRAEQA